MFGILYGRVYNSVDGCRFSNTNAPSTGPSKEQACLRSIFVCNDYTNPNINPRTLTTLTMTLTDPHNCYKEKAVSMS